ncbi:MAG: methionyl-tRNA formyltransferase [Lachnospiraceae bacterium]|nr:methionyl-tRNA formyltransferase [Lachnospiraceae bacterium]
MTKNDCRIVFMGTPELARTVLEAELSAGFNVVAAVTQPDKPKGRGGKVAVSPVKELCLEKGIPVLQPERAKSDEFFEELKSFEPDMITVAAYGKILPKRVLELPPLGCINVHTSLLPKYRGAAPIQWPILNGDSETGATIMFMDEGCDTGDIIAQERIAIADDETGETLHDKVAECGAKLLCETLLHILDGSFTRTPQDHSLSTYVGMMDKELGHLDFTKSARELERYVRGLSPWPGTFTYVNGKLLKIKKAAVKENSTDAAPGTIIRGKGCLDFVTGDGILSVTELQPEGKKAMGAADYLNGIKDELKVTEQQS